MRTPTSFQILDCSLRDGGYYTSWDFEPAFVEAYLNHLNKLPIDVIELGYRSRPKNGYFGPYFYCPEFVLEKAAKISNKKLAVLIDEKNVQPGEIKELLKPCIGIIELVRIAVSPEKLVNSLRLAGEIKKMGFEVSLNLMYLSAWESETNLIKTFRGGEEVVDYLYLVDSYGGVYPKQLERTLKSFSDQTDVKLGFHAHNNLELALINSLTAIECGVNIIDATVCGMGRGAGNLKTELLLTSLQATGKIEVDYDHLSALVSLFSDLEEKHKWGTNLAYMVSGSNSLAQQEVMARISKRFFSLTSIVREVNNRSKGIKDNMILEEFVPTGAFERALIVGGGPTGTKDAEAINAFLKKNSDFCIIHVSSKNAAAYADVHDLQIHCLAGNEGQRLETVFENLQEGNRIAVLPPFPRTMGTYIPKALKEKAFQLKEFSFAGEFAESTTALSIETALKLQVKEIFFVGYDGYSGAVSGAEMELYQENEKIFEKLGTMEVRSCSLTATKYNNLKQESVFAFI